MTQEIKEYYDKLSGDYDRDRFANSYGQFIHRQEKKIIEKYIPKDGLVLDLACGTGRFMQFATHGTDLSSQMMEVAKSKYPDKTYMQADAKKLPFGDNTFDAIFSFHLFMHLNPDDTAQILDECKRILKSDGILLFDFPSEKRRGLTNGHHNSSWHGSSAYSVNDLEYKMKESWNLKKSVGILFTPIHRIPNSLRTLFGWLDDWLCRSAFKAYSSYIVVVFQKQ